MLFHVSQGILPLFFNFLDLFSVIFEIPFRFFYGLIYF
nr:MAG TPA: hypothetical protein [Caudoviricetes sp.]